jgi:hypothetical protein
MGEARPRGGGKRPRSRGLDARPLLRSFPLLCPHRASHVRHVGRHVTPSASAPLTRCRGQPVTAHVQHRCHKSCVAAQDAPSAPLARPRRRQQRSLGLAALFRTATAAAGRLALWRVARRRYRCRPHSRRGEALMLASRLCMHLLHGLPFGWVAGGQVGPQPDCLVLQACHTPIPAAKGVLEQRGLTQSARWRPMGTMG